MSKHEIKKDIIKSSAAHRHCKILWTISLGCGKSGGGPSHLHGRHRGLGHCRLRGCCRSRQCRGNFDGRCKGSGLQYLKKQQCMDDRSLEECEYAYPVSSVGKAFNSRNGGRQFLPIHANTLKYKR